MKTCKSCGSSFDVTGDFEITCNHCLNLTDLMQNILNERNKVNYYKKFKVELRGAKDE